MVNNGIDSIYVDSLSLTKREMEVLELLASGASNQEIAAALVVELTTVKWYNAQIYDKLQVKNRKEAVIRAQTLGIIRTNSSSPFQQIQHNLPADTIPFIGRTNEIREIVQQLTDGTLRLITILGTGGMGKTCLSIEVGRRLIGHFMDGVYFVPLATVIATEQIVTTLAEIIGLKLQGEKPPKHQLLNHLRKQHILLILDNFEHLVDSADLLSDILQNAPKARVLVTSREKLNLAGERVHTLSGLSTPIDEATESFADFDSVKLFIETTQRTGIEVKDSEMAIVSRICRLVEGMPLAILLAVAWVDTLPISEIEVEIKAGLGILEANLRDAAPRHHSIHTTFDVSWKRLSHYEQAIFMRLSVFRNGFTREAAQKVTGASVRDLQRLVHTSFIQLLPSGRYAVHELMRQYGEEKLQASGELVTTREKHAQFFAEFITPLGETSWSMASREMLAEVHADFENVRAAWLFQAEEKNIPELRRFLDGIWHFLDQYSRSQEGIDLFEPLLTVFQDNNDDVTLFRGQLSGRLGWFYSDIGQHQKAIATAKQCLQIVQAFHATDDILLLHQLLWLVLGFTNNLQEAMNYVEKGYELVQKKPDSKWMTPLRYDMSFCYQARGNFDEAQRLIEALPEYKYQTSARSRLLRQAGEAAKAEELLLSGLKKYHHHRIDYLQTYSFLISWATEDGNYQKAWMYVQRGLQYGDDGAYAWGTFDMLCYVLALIIAEQQHRHAIELLSLILHHPASTGSAKRWSSKYEDTLKGILSAEEFEVAWERGKHLDLGEVITEYMER